MKMLFTFLFLISNFLLLKAHEPFDLQTSINLITGEWNECNIDLEMQGLVLKRRFYEVPRDLDPVAAGWDFNLPDLGKKEIPRKRLLPPEGCVFNCSYTLDGWLEKIEWVHTRTKQIKGWFDIHYTVDTCRIESNLGDFVIYGFFINDVGLRVLQYVEKSSGERWDYSYIPHPFKRGLLLTEKKENNGHVLKVIYDLKTAKIIEVISCFDDKEAYRYVLDYAPNVTRVKDSANVLNHYHFNEDCQIEKVETFLPDSTLYCFKELEWKGQLLIRKTLLDGFGDILMQERWIYDENKNLIQEFLEGTLTKASAHLESFTKYYEYDSKNRLIKEYDDEGLSFSYEYHETEMLPYSKCVLDQERTLYFYDEEKRLIETRIESSSNLIHFEKIYGFNAFDRPLEIHKGMQDQIQEKILYAYDTSGNLLLETHFDEKGKESWISNSYSPEGILIKSADSSGITTLFSLHEKHVFYESCETAFYYSNQNRLIKEETFHKGEKISSLRYIYNALGQMSEKIENESTVTSYIYDCFGRLIQEISPEVLSEDGPLCLTTKYIYNPLHQMISRSKYNIRGQILIDERGEKQYTLSGRLKEEIFTDKTSIVYDYDRLGQVTNKIFFDSNHQILYSKTNIYSNSHLIKELFSSGMSIDHSYDLYGNKIRSSCPETGRETTYESEILKPIIKTSEESNTHLTWTVNERGQTVIKQTLKFPTGFYQTILYDALKRKEQVDSFSPTDQLLSTQHLRHDFRGNKTKETHISAGKIITNRWIYDDFGRLLALVEAEKTVNERQLTYRYTPCGKLEAQIDASGMEILYSYNSAGRLCRLTSSDGSIDYGLAYDSAGQIHLLEDHVHGYLGERKYNLEGQLIEEKLSNGLLIQNAYDTQGRRHALTLPDLSSIHYFFDELHLKEIIRKSAKGTILYSHTYTSFDEDNQPLSAELIHNLGMLVLSRNSDKKISQVTCPYFSETASYDDQKRLISLKSTDAGVDSESLYTYTPNGFQEKGLFCNDYTFDSFENRIIQNGNLISTNALNQIFYESGPLLDYDLAGNLIKKIQNETIFEFSYDPLNRLKEVKINGEVIHSYIYDLFHRRLMDQVSSQLFLYDGNWEMGNATLDGDIVALRVFNVSQTAEHGICVAFELEGALYAPIYGITGSLGALISVDQKKIVERYRYSAFGEPLNPSKIHPWQFANKRMCQKTGLVHFGRRDYDPSIGRFMTPDPLGFADGINRYAFTHNNPLNQCDYFGLMSWDGFKADVCTFFENLKEKIIAFFQTLKKNASLGRSEIFEHMAGSGFLLLSGYSITEPESGVYGKGEVNDKVRISFTNGILTPHSSFSSSLKALSESHGNVNIHYVYRPTKGWVWDVLHSFAVNMGLVSSQAELLAASWKKMIGEMGGAHGGGKIIHYAHSIGTIETIRALGLLTEEEQKLIHIYAFGCPNLTEENPAYQIHHFVSIRDGIPLLHLAAFIQACQGSIKNVVFTGSVMGIPFVDHLFLGQTYQDIWKSMGRTFTEWYGSL